MTSLIRKTAVETGGATGVCLAKSFIERRALVFIFDPSINDRTDRFAYRFVRP